MRFLCCNAMAPSQTPEVLQLSSSVRRHGMLALPSTKHLHWRWTCEEYLGKSSSGRHLPLWTLHPALLFPYLLSGLYRRAAWALLHKVFPLDMSGAGLLLYQRAARLTLQASILSKIPLEPNSFYSNHFHETERNVKSSDFCQLSSQRPDQNIHSSKGVTVPYCYLG